MLCENVCETEEQAEKAVHAHTHKCSTPPLQTHSGLHKSYCRQQRVETSYSQIKITLNKKNQKKIKYCDIKQLNLC